MTMRKPTIGLLALCIAAALAAGCTQERQNQIKREIQNWTGTDGVLEVYAGDQVVKRFMKIDKLSTALGTDDNRPRAYRFGYGVLDANLNGVADPDEKRVYFELSDYATYVFFENPK
jgi:opacity protein-like surface antigen